MFTSIHLNSELQKQYSLENDSQELLLGKINLFVGPNNSGKSRFLRECFSNANVEFNDETNLKDFSNAIKQVKSELNDYCSRNGIKFTGLDISDLQEVNYQSEKNAVLISNSTKTFEKLIKPHSITVTTVGAAYVTDVQVKAKFSEIHSRYRKQIENLSEY